MSTTTTNLGLIKPELTDVADITATNANWDIIDEELKNGKAFVVTATIMPSSVTVDKTFNEIYAAWSNGTKVYMSVSNGQYILTPTSVSSTSMNFTTVYSYSGKLTLWVVAVFSNNRADQITYVFPTTDEMEAAIATIPPQVIGQIMDHDNDANAHFSIRNAMMPKAGGTMTGNLKISKANSPTIELQTSSSNGYTNIYQHGGLLNISSSMSNNDSDETSLVISVPSDDDSDLVRIERTVNNSSRYYKLYGEHNKPTAEDVGAATPAYVDEQIGVLAPISSTLTLNWSSGETYTATVEGVTSSNTVIVAPSPDYYEVYTECGIKCISQNTDTLIFECDAIPNRNVGVNVLIINS